MKRYSSLVMAVCVLLVCCTSASIAVEYPKPVGTAQYKMQFGWYAGAPAWYIATATNDIRFAMSLGLTLAPLLASANTGGAPELYWVTNFNNYGPAFSTAPGLATYSGLWDVQYVTWLPGVTPWVISDPDATPGGAPGLPTGLQATITNSNVIVDFPIMALGNLGGPWYPAPAGAYRIKQGTVASNYPYTKLINLPKYPVFCQNQTTRAVSKRYVIITDVNEADLAAALGANLAETLADVDAANRQLFWFIEGGPYLCQWPVLEYCPTYLSWRNTQFAYSPIMDFTRLARAAGLPNSTVVNNPVFLQDLVTHGLLTPVLDGAVVNANLVP